MTSPGGPTDESRAAGAAERSALARRAGVVGAGTLLSRVLGLVRDQTLAALFGRGETDAFWVAFTIPNALRQLLAEGAMSSAVVPVLAEVRAREGDDAARLFLRRMRGVSLVALVLACVAGIAFAPQLVELFAGGLHQRAGGAFERTVSLTRWVFPYLLFMGSAALGMAALNTWGRFAAAAFAPGLLNVAFIACAFGLPAWLAAHGHDRLLALAAGALVGGALQVVAQVPALRAIGVAGWPRFTLRDPRVRQVLRRMVPMLAGIGVYAVDLMIARRFLSSLPEGSQSWFSWAMRLCDFPQGIFVLALQAATLPSLAKLAAAGMEEEVEATYAYGMRLAMFVAVPATALVVGLARPLVVLLFERGAFDALSSTETAHALVAQGVGIWTVAAVRQLLPVFYALGDTRTPVLVSAIDLVAFIVLAFVLRGPLGHVGVGWAVAGSSFVQMALLWATLGRRLRSLRLGEIAASVARTAAASVLAAVGAATAARLAYVGPGPLARLLPGAAGLAAFGAIFVAAAWALGSTELEALLGAAARRLRARRGRV